jgi:hypothetical protein
MSTTPDTRYEEPYRAAMNGIADKIAMQTIRKVIRGTQDDGEKLNTIIGIVHAYEKDLGREG